MKSVRCLAVVLLTCASSSVLAQAWGAVRVAPMPAAPVVVTSVRLPVATVVPPPPPVWVRPVVVAPQICHWSPRADGSMVQRCN